VVTKSDRCVYPGYYCFLPHEDHINANINTNEHDKLKMYDLLHNGCKINKVN